MLLLTTMAKVEKVSIALTSDLLAAVRAAVDSGDYASNSEVLREALREWRERRSSLHVAEQKREFAGFATPRDEAKPAKQKRKIISEIQHRVSKLPELESMDEVDAWMYDDDGLPH